MFPYFQLRNADTVGSSPFYWNFKASQSVLKPKIPGALRISQDLEMKIINLPTKLIS